MAEARCGSCRFWEEVGADGSGRRYGLCHRYPRCAPGMTEEWWCGEWERNMLLAAQVEETNDG